MIFFKILVQNFGETGHENVIKTMKMTVCFRFSYLWLHWSLSSFNSERDQLD